MNTTDQKPAANEWSSYWGGDTAGAEVFVGQDGEAHPAIAQWWRKVFSGLSSGLEIVDLACGSGSVFQHLPKDHDVRLHGADISDEALGLIRERIPDINTTTCSADALPFADGQFDMAVSQFGIEYAGDDAFVEAVRVVAPGGQLRMLCHIRDGYIDARNQVHLIHAKKIVECDFLTLALNLISTITEGDKVDIASAAKNFQAAEKQLAESCVSLPEGIHVHLYQGFRQLYEQQKQYSTDDILGWLNAMEHDVERNILRLQHMCAAAKSKQQFSEINARMKAAGCQDMTYKPFYISGHDQPLAWAVHAKK